MEAGSVPESALLNSQRALSNTPATKVRVKLLL